MRVREYIIFYTILILVFFIPKGGHALQVVAPVEGESVFVNISKEELNLIQFPFTGIRAYTTSQDIDIKVHSQQVLVTMVNRAVAKPQEVFFSTPYGTYLLMLVPKSIPAETVMVRIDREKIEEAEEWEMESDYIQRLKELVKSLYLGAPPNGYSFNTIKKDASRWEGIEETIITTMRGAGLVGEVHEICNHGKKTVRIAESEFYREGVLAVSLTGYEIREGAREKAFIVRRNTLSSGAADRFVRSPLREERANND